MAGTVYSAQITQVSPKPTAVPQVYSDVRYALRITFHDNGVVWIVSHEDSIAQLPNGASVLAARLLDEAMPRLDRNAGFESGRATSPTATYQVADVDDAFTDLLANKQVNGYGSFNTLIEEFEFGTNEVINLNPQSSLAQYPAKFTGIIQNHAKPYNIVRLECSDLNRELDQDIFDPIIWHLKNDLDENATENIKTTLPVGEIDEHQVMFKHMPWYPNPDETGGYIKIDEEIIWYTAFVDVGGVSTFTGVKRAQLGTAQAAHTVDPATVDAQKPEIREIIYIDESPTNLVIGLITGFLAGARPLPSHWCLGYSDRWINRASFAKYSSSERVRFKDYGKTKCRVFYEKEILLLNGAVLVVDGSGQLNWTPRVMPVDTSAGEYVLDPSNCVETNDLVLDHIKTDIHPSIKISYDYEPATDTFYQQVTYRDLESETHNKIIGGKKIKELEFKGLHSGIYTSTQLSKLAATMGDDYFYEKQKLVVESYLNNIQLGSLVSVNFPNVLDDASGDSQAKALNRTMLVVASSEDRSRRTTTYTLSGSLNIQSIRQAGIAQNNLAIAEYKRGKYNLEDVANISINNSIATGTINLLMGRHYYYVNDASPGTGLELGEALTVNITGDGPMLGLHVFGPLAIKTTLDLSERSKHYPGAGGTQSTPAQAGDRGYCVSMMSSSSFDTKVVYGSFEGEGVMVYFRSGVEVNRLHRGIRNNALYARAPDPALSVNNGILDGLPADLGGTAGSGGPASTHTDANRQPLGSPTNFSGARTSPLYLPGSAGGKGGGGLLIVSWGGSVTGNGLIKLNGADAAPAQSLTIQQPTLYGSTGGPGGPGSLLWVVDGNHPPPTLTNQNVEAFPGHADIPGTPVRFEQKIRTAGNFRPGYTNPTIYQNFRESVVRIAYTPEAEILQPRPLSSFDQFFANQRDGEVELYVLDADPSNANLGDARITQQQLDAGGTEPVFRILSDTGWRNYAYGVDKFRSLYLALINNLKAGGGDTILSSTTRPVGRTGNLWHNSNNGSVVRLLANGPPDELIMAGEALVGANKYKDGNFVRYAAGEITWIFLDNLAKPFTFPSGSVVPGGGTNPYYALDSPLNVRVGVYSSTTVEVRWSPAADTAGLTGYEIRRNSALITTVSGTSYLDTGLAPSTSYTYSVRAVGPELRSEDIGFTIITPSADSGGTLNPPNNLRGTIYSSTALELFWDLSTSNGVTGYEIVRDGTQIGTVGDVSGSFFESTLTPGTTYVYQVRAISGSDTSAYSQVTLTTN